MDSISINTLLLSLFVLIVLSAFFSSSEIGMMALNRYRLRHMALKKIRGAVRVKRLLDRTDRLLSVILIGNTFANILASALMTIICVRLFGDVGVAIGTIGLTFVILIFAEIAPKTVAALYPERVAFLASVPLSLLQRLFAPLVWLANGITRVLLRLCRIDVNPKKSEHLSGEELRMVVHEAGTLIPSEHRKMLLSIFDLEKVTVEDIMVPRSEISGIDLSDDWDDILEQLENSQYTRLPIYEESIDKVKGVVHLRSVLNLLADNKLNKESLLSIAESCHFIPEATPLNTQLLNFRKEKTRIGFVVDEYGDIDGLATMEDILEEIVGEFTTDVADVIKEVYPQSDGSVIVDASISIRDLNRSMQWKLPTSGPKTLNGLIIEYLEFIPASSVGLKIENYPMEVIQTSPHRIKTVRILAKAVS